MPNIILTNKCNLNCPYCFAKKTTRKKSSLFGKAMSFDNFKTTLSFLKRNKEKKVRLIGGEPTLHFQLKKFVNYALSHNFNIHIFTNALFPPQITDFFVSKGDLIKYSFNINHPHSYDKAQWRNLSRNLERITFFKNSVLGTVIWQRDFNLDYIIELSKRYFFKNLTLRLANPIFGERNKYIKEEWFLSAAKNLINEIKKIKKIGLSIDFGCGLAKGIFSDKQIKILKESGLKCLNDWGCVNNTGRFDINPDLFVFRCFPLANLGRKKLTEFDNIREVESYFARILSSYQKNNSKKDYIHNGPCFAYLLKQGEKI